MLLRLDTLNKLFASHSSTKPIRSRGICRDCGGEVEIRICRTTGGFGLQGGVLYEPEPKKFIAKCRDCYQKGPELISDDIFIERYGSFTTGASSTGFFCRISH
jgi:hypothetical protein